MKAVKFARLTRNLTQARFGRMAGLTQNQVSDIELGRLIPTDRQKRRMTRALGLPECMADELLHDFPDPLKPTVEPEDRPVRVAEPESVQ